MLLTSTSVLAQSASSEFSLPSNHSSVGVLSSKDVRLYRDIMEDERAGAFRKAQSDVERLDDLSLEGYAEAEHYLRARRPPVKALVGWLEKYRELPVAEHVYRLAVSRSTRRVRHHHHTILVAVVTNIPVPGPEPHHRGGGYEDVDMPGPSLISEQARAQQPQIEMAVRSSQPDLAANALLAAQSQGAPSVDIARLSHRVASSYMAEGKDAQALQIVEAVSEGDKSSVPLLYWDEGLAQYRLHNFPAAAKAFEALASSGSVPNWTLGAAAFWAARAYMQTTAVDRVVPLLQIAAKAEPTFYGLIAERMLGQDTATGFSDPGVDPNEFALLMQDAAAHRAVALHQIGDDEDAILELERAFGETDSRLDTTFAAVAHELNAPNIELRASESCASRGLMLTGLFPVPGYRPEGGYRIDPSLILAFVRAESRFQERATSPAGARGVMQIMPGTAVRLGGSGSDERLYDASFNMTLGQRFLENLLGEMNGNLVELAASYNAGPGALTRWMGANSAMLDDPLLFIESMPVAETRAYVKRVLTYHWMYSRRLGNEAKSLDDTASGGWPLYRPPTASVQSPPISTPVGAPVAPPSQNGYARPTS
jgi:soluble lytic murein transglycosylase-like protein